MALLERETELSALDAALDGACAGAGTPVLIEGHAGQGKSALVAAARDRATRRGMRVLSARGAVLEREFPLGAVRQLFEALPAEPLFPGEPPAPEAVSEALYWRTLELAGDAPLLLVLDDAHWADVSSLRALTLLAARLGDMPVALVTTLRPSEPGAPEDVLDELRSGPAVVRLTARPLGPDGVATVVRGRLPGADRELCAACAEVSGGNPLYLRELLRAAAASDRAPPTAEDVLRAAVPSLGERVARRIAGVAPEAPVLAEALAVLGDGTELATAAELVGLEADDARAVADALRAIEVLAPDDPPAFVHPLVRQSVYDSISAVDREALHARAAATLRTRGAGIEAIAGQVAQLPPRADPLVAETLLEAARRALAQGAPDEAVRWLERGLAEGATEPDPATLVAELAAAEMIRRSPIALERLHEAYARVVDPGPRTRLAIAIADTAMLSGDWHLAARTIGAARAALADGDVATETELAALGRMIAVHHGATAFPLDAARVAELVDRPGWGARALAAVLAADAANRGDVPRARVLLDRAFEGDVLLGERLSTPWAVAQALVALAHLDEYERGLAVSRRLATAAVARGSVNARHTAADHRALLQTRAGDLVAAEAEVRPGLEVGLAMGAPTVTACQLFWVADAVLERPGFADAADLACTMDTAAVAGTSAGAGLLHVRGRIRHALRDRTGAVADLRGAVAVADDLALGPAVAPFRSALALALPRDERDEARSLVADEVRAARATGLPRPIGVALRAAGALAGGAEGVALLEDAVATLARSPARLEHARALVELGAALRRQHRRAEAREPLGQGLALAEACGARRSADRAREELRTVGGATRSQRGPDRDRLTPSELRVARRAAEGASNREIAQELFLSLKTVETHLSSAYTKLGLSGRGSRRRLAAALAGLA